MEKKSKKAKEASMEVQKEEKLTYEQLEQVANNLNQQCRQMYQKLQEAQEVISNFNDIAMLLTVLEKAEFFEDEFVHKCAERIQKNISEIIDPKQEETEAN